MANKSTFRDILPPNEKSIRRIPLTKGSETANLNADKDNVKINMDNDSDDVNLKSLGKRNKNKKYRFWLWTSISLILIVLIVVFGRSSAKIDVTLKNIDFDFNQELVASKTALPSSVPFEIITLSKDLEKEMQSTGEKDAELKASGEIVIFNKYSENAQTLIKNTRFETPDGKIYRISESINVPGYTTKNNEIIPGQIKTRVYADFPGDEYNIDLIDFTIPGFKGLPQFEKMFARSATKMTGGFIGRIKTVDRDILANNLSSMQSELENTVRNNIVSEIPEGFILLPQSLNMTFESLPQKSSGSSVMITERITAVGIMLNKDVLVSKIIESALGGSNDKINISNLEKLTFELENALTDIKKIESFKFNLSGKANLVWVLDSDKLTNHLAGKSKKNLPDILAKYNSVEKAVSSLKPFWKRSFPKNTSKIEIFIVN